LIEDYLAKNLRFMLIQTYKFTDGYSDYLF
jgi:hypothetical protein